MNESIEGPAAAGSATAERPILLELTLEQLHLVEAGVKLLLAIEDDRVAVHELKDLLERVRTLDGRQE